MPFRTHQREGYPDRTKIQFTTDAAMPSLVHQACKATGAVSNTVYIQHAVVDALARDLGLDRDTLLAALPQPKGPAAHLYDPDGGHTMDRYSRRSIPGLNSPIIEEVR